MTERTAIAIFSLLFVGFAGWHVGGQLSSDALAMAIGALLATLGCVTSVMVILASRRYDPVHRAPQYQQLPPPINLAPPMPKSRGERIEQALCNNGFECKLIKEIHSGDGRAVYTFAFRIGTRVSSVARFADDVLTRGSGSQFRVDRVGGEMVIYEQARGAVYVEETATKQISSTNYIESIGY